MSVKLRGERGKGENKEGEWERGRKGEREERRERGREKGVGGSE